MAREKSTQQWTILRKNDAPLKPLSCAYSDFSVLEASNDQQHSFLNGL